MITRDLLEYIKIQTSLNVSRDIIISRLSQAGWHMEDIEEGFLSLEPIITVNTPLPNLNDKLSLEDFSSKKTYEEENKKPIEISDSVFETKNAEPLEENFDLYRELPEMAQKEEIPIEYQPKEETAIEDSSVSEIAKEEIVAIPEVVEVAPEIIEEKPEVISVFQKIEPLKIWTPSSEESKIEEKKEPVVSNSNLVNQSNIETEVQNKTEVLIPTEEEKSNEIEISKIELTQGEKITPITPIVAVNPSPITPINPAPIIPVTMAIPVVAETSLVINPDPFSEGVSPKLNEVRKIEPTSEFIPIINKNPIEKVSLLKVNLPPAKPQTVKNITSQNSMSDIVPRNAMISSYAQDVLSVEKEEEKIVPSKKKSLIKWGIIIFIISLVGAMIFAFVEGYIKIPGSKFSFFLVKKDPRNIVLNSSSNISKLKSYKIENEISISSPSLSNITSGLVSGEVVTSKDRDSIGITAKGLANHQNGKLFFDYMLTLKSSIWENDINSNWKYDGDNLYMSIPDLSQILGKSAPVPTTLIMKTDQLGLLVPEFSTSIQETLKKFDVYNMMSGSIPLYVKNESTSIFKEFINNMEYVDKGVETIHGVETHHYLLTVDRVTTKKFLNSLADLFILELPADQKKNLVEAIGASTFSSFDVWIGKNDNNLYQIKFTLSMPLSKVLGLNDSGIADNEVKLDWRTTYYDLDIENNISMPSVQVDMTSFIKNIQDSKIKNIISTFRPNATAFRNAVGSYGLRTNPTGSCTNPNPGSLFSPKGHSKAADTAIGMISTSMKDLLLATNGVGSCYSTSKDWALAAPLFNNPDPQAPNFYCVDSAGNLTTLSSLINGPVCK